MPTGCQCLHYNLIHNVVAGRCSWEDAQDPSTVASELCAQQEYQQTTHPLFDHFSSNYKTQRITKKGTNSIFNVTTNVFCRTPECRGLWKKSFVINLKLQTFLISRQPTSGPRHCLWSSSITLRHTTLGRTPLDEWSARRRDVYLTYNTHNRHIHASDRSRTPNPSKTAASKPHLRRRGHRDRRN
jgi:hypothetical protein